MNPAIIGLLGALKGKCIDEEVIEGLKEFSLEEALAYLRENYIIVQEEVPRYDKLRQMERYLTLTYLKNGSKFLRFLRGKEFDLIRTILREYDIYNLKIVLKSILFGGEVLSDELYILPFSIFYRKRNFSNLEELYKYLRREKDYLIILEKAIEEYRRRRDPFYLEARLDRGWLDLLDIKAERFGPPLYHLLQEFVSLFDLIWACRMLFYQGKGLEEVLGLLCLKGSFNKDLFIQLSKGRDINQALSFIQESLGCKIEGEDWEGHLRGNFMKEHLKDIKIGFSLLPIVKFLLKERFLLEQVIQLLNTKAQS